MNYLAHAFLSFGKPEIIAGSLIADFVKGKKQYSFMAGIQRGIVLHRAIDAFTDDHAATRRARVFFVPACGRYSGAFLDVVYDHFLATDRRYFKEETLGRFSEHIYQTIESFGQVLPPKFMTTFYYMKMQDWLSGYSRKENIFKAFRGIYRRAAYLEENDGADTAFEDHYEAFHYYYQLFMPDLVSFATEKLKRLTG